MSVAKKIFVTCKSFKWDGIAEVQSAELEAVQLSVLNYNPVMADFPQNVNKKRPPKGGLLRRRQEKDVNLS